jgi:class 3 adenylate cyclase
MTTEESSMAASLESSLQTGRALSGRRRRDDPATHSNAGAEEGLLALLVTDLMGFTAMVERLGDERAREVIHRHNRTLRSCVFAHHGHEVAHTGDGMVVSFRSLGAALRCACEMQQSLRDQSRSHLESPLRIRIGIHVGEPLQEEDRLFGHCVNVAVRVCGRAAPGTILVTPVVTQIAHARYAFERGRACPLKGVTSPLRLSELLWEAPTAATPQDDTQNGIGLLGLSMDSWLSTILDNGRISTILTRLARRSARE